MADLVTAVSLGTTARLISPSGPSMVALTVLPCGPSMVALTVLPLSLVPTFLVPLFTIFYVICIAQARKWKSALDTVRSSARVVMQHPAA